MTGYTDIEENVLEFFKENEIVGSIFVNTDIYLYIHMEKNILIMEENIQIIIYLKKMY